MTEVMTERIRSFKDRFGISAAALKWIAIITMLIDHTGATIIARLRWTYFSSSAPNVVSFYNNLYYYSRRIGRLAFPIFCYMIVEGYFHTRDVKKYAGRLFLFALISEFSFDFALHHGQSLLAKQNVYWTLVIGLIVIWFVNDIFRGMLPAQLICLCAGMLLAYFMRTDYSYKGVFLIESLYVLRFSRPLQLLGGAAFVEYERMPTPLSFLIIWLYNGKKGRQLKYFFYLFYPLHLLILGVICYYLLPVIFG